MEVLIMSTGRLTRSRQDRMLAGVCGGLAEYLGIDSTLVRLGFLILLFASGIGFPIYIILLIVMPNGDGSQEISSDTIQKNLGEMSDKVYNGVSRIGRPGTIGALLILFGAYFLLNELGIGGVVFWPVVLIGLGIYLLIRRRV